MRTKTLLLTAAVAAAGMLAANAQVYSVNAVGYVNKTVPAGGFALISNPLLAPTNTLDALLSSQVSPNTQVYIWNTTTKRFDIDAYDADFGWNNPNTEIKPGQGFFIRNPGAAEMKITFVGEVPQGTGANALTTTLVPGFQIVSSQVPQQGTATDLKYTATANDQIYQWDAAGNKYTIYQYDAEFQDWSPALKALDVGEAFFLKRDTAGTWTREFTVNTP